MKRYFSLISFLIFSQTLAALDQDTALTTLDQSIAVEREKHHSSVIKRLLSLLRHNSDRKLFDAIYGGSVKQIQQCLKNGANLKARNPEAETPIEYATRLNLVLLASEIANFTGQFVDIVALEDEMEEAQEKARKIRCTKNCIFLDVQY